jgi:hypothetical protein
MMSSSPAYDARTEAVYRSAYLLSTFSVTRLAAHSGVPIEFIKRLIASDAANFLNKDEATQGITRKGRKFVEQAIFREKASRHGELTAPVSALDFVEAVIGQLEGNSRPEDELDLIIEAAHNLRLSATKARGASRDITQDATVTYDRKRLAYARQSLNSRLESLGVRRRIEEVFGREDLEKKLATKK